MLNTITPDQAAQMLQLGATTVDVREPDEHAPQRLPGARNPPQSRLAESHLVVPAARTGRVPCHLPPPIAGHARALASAGRRCQAPDCD